MIRSMSLKLVFSTSPLWSMPALVIDLVDFAEVGEDGVGVSQNGLAFGDVEPIRLHVRAQCFCPAHGFS
jgi:hypothetical protein